LPGEQWGAAGREVGALIPTKYLFNIVLVKASVQEL